jgi:hypothetical protein
MMTVCIVLCMCRVLAAEQVLLDMETVDTYACVHVHKPAQSL